MGSEIQKEFVGLVVILSDDIVEFHVCEDEDDANFILQYEYSIENAPYKFYLFPFKIGLEYLWTIDQR